MTSPLPSLRTFLALDLITVWPIETWPSPPTTTLPPLRTVKMVVPCQTCGSFDACMGYPLVRPDLGVAARGYNRRAFAAECAHHRRRGRPESGHPAVAKASSAC